MHKYYFTCCIVDIYELSGILYMFSDCTPSSMIISSTDAYADLQNPIGLQAIRLFLLTKTRYQIGIGLKFKKSKITNVIRTIGSRYPWRNCVQIEMPTVDYVVLSSSYRPLNFTRVSNEGERIIDACTVCLSRVCQSVSRARARTQQQQRPQVRANGRGSARVCARVCGQSARYM